MPLPHSIYMLQCRGAGLLTLGERSFNSLFIHQYIRLPFCIVCAGGSYVGVYAAADGRDVRIAFDRGSLTYTSSNFSDSGSR
jgi:hypothetical protein